MDKHDHQRQKMAQIFLQKSGWANAKRHFLAGDASNRHYERLYAPPKGVTAILMDSSLDSVDDPASFVKISHHLNDTGLSAPKIYAQDLQNGFLLLEDFGDNLYARILEKEPEKENQLYCGAVDVLCHLQKHPHPPDLPELTAQEWAEAAALCLETYAGLPADDDITKSKKGPLKQDFITCLTEITERHANGPKVMALRDYHAENLFYFPERSGVSRVGLLDFQQAQLGQPAYDLISLLQDARRDVSTEVVKAVMARFAGLTGVSADELATSAAVLGSQRALRILGIFSRLCLISGKSQYIDFIPRVWGHLWQNLSHPTLAPLRLICEKLLPLPTPNFLAEMVRNARPQ